MLHDHNNVPIDRDASSGDTVTDWRQQLRQLDGFPLLAVHGKYPVDPLRFRPHKDDPSRPAGLGRWQKADHPFDQVAACSWATGCGVRTGRDALGLLVFDIDGQTALDHAIDSGCDPTTAGTWLIRRTTATDRLKACFIATDDQLDQLEAAAGGAPFHHQYKTRQKVVADGKTVEKDQAIELFAGVGQIVAIGAHPDSGGHYFWDGSPADVAPLPDEWFDLAMQIAEQVPTRKAGPTTAPKGSSRNWSKLRDKCPICGRDSHHICAGTSDGLLVNCVDGQSFSFVAAHGHLDVGDVVKGSDGSEWFLLESPRYNGQIGSDTATFKRHDPDWKPDPEKRKPVSKTPKKADDPEWSPPEQSEIRSPNGGPSAPVTPVLESPVSIELDKLTGIAAVVAAIGDGWNIADDGTRKRSRITCGDLSDRWTAALGDRLGFDEMNLLPAVDGQTLRPTEIDQLHVKLNRSGWTVGREPTTDGLLESAHQRPFHPIRSYLNRIADDDSIVPIELDSFGKDYFQVADTLQQSFLRIMLLGAVWRVMQPGITFKTCVVLNSGQTYFKSESLRRLASPEWFCDSHQEQDKDMKLAIHSTWIYELAELESITGRKEAGQLKNIISSPSELLRVPYGRGMERMPRASVFVGTTNTSDFLRDETGNHRFLVVELDKPLDFKLIERDRDRIWKAAALAYRNGEMPYLSQASIEASEIRNEDFIAEDPWLALLEKWTKSASCPALFNTADALVKSGCVKEGQTHSGQSRKAASLLKSLGFVQLSQRRINGDRARPWSKAPVTDSNCDTDDSRDASGTATKQSQTGVSPTVTDVTDKKRESSSSNGGSSTGGTGERKGEVGDSFCDIGDTAETHCGAADLPFTDSGTDTVTSDASDAVTHQRTAVPPAVGTQVQIKLPGKGWVRGEISDTEGADVIFLVDDFSTTRKSISSEGLHWKRVSMN